MNKYKYKNKYKRVIAQLLLSIFLFENCTQLNLTPASTDSQPTEQNNLPGGTASKLKEAGSLGQKRDSELRLASELGNINLGTLTSTQGFTINGAAAGDNTGYSVNSAGDVNSDGLSDLIIGVPNASPSNRTNAGSSYVIYGVKGGYTSIIDLASLSNTTGFRIDGATSNGFSGWSVSTAGDVNGDYIDDIIIGAYAASPNAKTQAGSSYVIYGVKGGYPSAIDLLNLSSTIGFRINGAMPNERSGYSVRNAGDINGDNIEDLIIGAPNSAPNGKTNAGSSYVIYGAKGGYASGIDLASLSSATGFRIDGATAGGLAGFSANSAGDVNSDGFDDLIIGVPDASPSNKTSAGSCYVVYGKQCGYASGIDLASLSSTTGFRIDGIAQNDLTGYSVSSAGDVNADEIEDFIIGALNSSPDSRINAGSSYVIYGIKGGYAGIDLTNFPSTVGFRINGAVAGDLVGRSVSSAGDINGDGVKDVIIGAPSSLSSNGTHAGKSYVVYGMKGGYASAIDLANLSNTVGFRIDGAAPGDRAGRSVSSAGDINGDGVNDLIIGATDSSPNNRTKAGASYVIYGNNQPPKLSTNSLSLQGVEAITLSSSNLYATDVDNDNNSLIFKIHQLQAGQFFNGLYQPTLQFTQQEVASGMIHFVSASCTLAPSYNVSVSDAIHTTAPTPAVVMFTPCTVSGSTTNCFVSAASSLEVPWYSPARWFNAVRSYFQSSQPAIDTVEAEGLLKLQRKCARMIEEADSKTADKWYRFSLEDLQEDIEAMLNKQPGLITEETVDRFRGQLEGIYKDFLRAPLLEKPSFFAGTQNRIEINGLVINQEGSLLQPNMMPILGAGYVAPALGN